MNILKFSAVTLMVIAASVANAQSTYLTGANLRNAIEGQTLFGSKWAEFYESNGTIQGKASFWVRIQDSGLHMKIASATTILEKTKTHALNLRLVVTPLLTTLYQEN